MQIESMQIESVVNNKTDTYNLLKGFVISPSRVLKIFRLERLEMKSFWEHYLILDIQALPSLQSLP
jgi:hypothetical protein